MATTFGLALVLVVKHYEDYKTRELEERLKGVQIAFKQILQKIIRRYYNGTRNIIKLSC